jgi:LysM repeat protein
LSIEARSTATQLTVFTYYTADQDMRWHDAFWDDAALVLISSGGGGNTGNTGNSGNTGSNPTARPRATAAPVAQEAQTRPDGSQVHIVKSGQFLSTIAQAYGLTLNELLAINPNLTRDSIIRPGDAIIVKAASIVAAPTATFTPPSATGGSVTVTPISFPTAIAQVASPTSAAPSQVTVNVEDEGASDGAITQTLVQALAVVVIVGGVVVGGGVIAFVGWTVLRG